MGNMSSLLVRVACLIRRQPHDVWRDLGLSCGLIVVGGLLAAGCPLGTPVSGASIGFNIGGEPAAAEAAASSEPVFESVPIFTSIDGKTGSHAPSIVALDNGDLLAAWYSYDGPGELDGATVYVARRLAEAAGWSPPQVQLDRAAAVGNPVLYAEGARVWLFHAVVPGTGWSTAHIEVQRSTDAGETWMAPQVLSAMLGSNVRSPPIRLSTGELLLPAYDDLLQRSLFFASSDGVEWVLRSALVTPPPVQNLQPSIALGEDGAVVAVMRNGGRGWLWTSVSGDGGRTWATAADGGFDNPASPAALLRTPAGALVLALNDNDVRRRPLSVTMSTDDGRTWLPPRVVTDGDGSYAYPSVCASADGTLHLVYSHNRLWIQHVTFNMAWVAGGAEP